jgi:Domain of unknown function DUF11/Beta-propeller repeat
MLKAVRMFPAAIVILLATVTTSLFAQSTSSQKPGSPSINVPLAFEANRGQTAPQVRYLARTSEGVVFLTQDGFTISLPRAGSFRMLFDKANASPATAAEQPLIARSNYLSRDPGKSIVNLENFGAVRYQSVYPRIDVRFYGRGQHLEHDFLVAPGADANQIALRLDGIDKASMSSSGAVELKLGKITLDESAPVAWQMVNGARRQVHAEWKITGDNRLGISLGQYDHNLPLTIDPVLAYSTHLGGNTAQDIELGSTFPADTFIRNIALDGAGNVFVSGNTSAVDFPTTAGAFDRTPKTQASFHADTTTESGFVSKFDKTGRVLLYSTFLHNGISAMAVDSAGHAYTVEAANDNFNGPNNDADAGVFVDKLSADGSHLLYSFIFGATPVGSSCFTNGNTFPTGVAVDNSGHAWVTGDTGNPCLPATPGVIESNIGPSDFCGFLAKFDTNTSGAASVVYATYVGSASQAVPRAVTVDSSGNAYVTGVTGSGYPHTASFGTGNPDAFVTKFNATATARVYSTVFGSIGTNGSVAGVALDAGLNAYVVGGASSPTFPTTAGAFQRVVTGEACFPPDTELCPEGFVTKFNSTGSALVYSTLIGGAGRDEIHGVGVNNANMAFVTGLTSSANFPVTANAFKKTVQSVSAFVTAFQPNGQSLYYSTILGGGASTATSNASSIFVDPAWNAWVAGNTGQSDFPVTANAFQPGKKGNSDGFFSKIVITGDLKVTLGSNAASVARNGNVILTGDLFDLGPDGSDAVVFIEAIPAGYKFQGVSTNATSCTKPAVGATSGTVTCTQTRLESGQHFFVNVFVQAIAASGSNITSKATASARTQDLNQANNAASVTVHVN